MPRQVEILKALNHFELSRSLPPPPLAAPNSYTKFLNNYSLIINHSGRRQGQDQGQGQGQDHEKVRRRGAPLQLQMVLTLALALALAPSGMIDKKGGILAKISRKRYPKLSPKSVEIIRIIRKFRVPPGGQIRKQLYKQSIQNQSKLRPKSIKS